MNTQCTSTQLEFQAFGRRQVSGRFDGGRLTSDAGGLLLREVEQRLNVLPRLAGCFTDYRQTGKVEHSVQALLAQRIYGLALGYEDINDHDTLRNDSLPALLVGKAEHLAKGANPRFVVTSLDAKTAGAQVLYEELYCIRGEMENRIKEQQPGLFADRTSTATLRANQLRLYRSSFAYLLMHGLRRLGLAGTRWARAQCGTIRSQILKLAAIVRITARKVWLSFASGYPYQNEFAAVLAHLRRCPGRAPPG